MMKTISSRIRNFMLQRLLLDFIIDQIENPTAKSSELVDCATVLVEEVRP